ncbi:hypothetical protein [Proteus sp. fly-1008]|uniref:hypothetical protein n=1 Tax=Proteus sp. fly-1008 TaxID=3136672 RepID=UPI00280F0B74|nr:hypothetical protein [Proteus mirabilis]
MSDEVNPKNYPTSAAYQLTLEMIKAGSFTCESHGGKRKALDVIDFFNALNERFEKLQDN